MLSHWSVYACYAMLVHKRMESGDIAVADNPLGIGTQRQFVEALKQMHHSVATSATDNRLDVRVKDGGAQIGVTLIGGSAESAPFTKCVWSNLYSPSLLFKYFYSICNKLTLNSSSR